MTESTAVPGTKKRVLVVGGAGHVGRVLAPALESKYAVRYMDVAPVPDAEDRTITGSVTDADTVERAVGDMDAVVYLAMGSHRDIPGGPDSIQSQFDVNVQGVYRVLAASLAAGIKRFVYASSLSVYGARRRPPQVNESHEPDAWRPYGLSKRLGERLCEIASRTHPDVTLVGLRLVRPLNEAQHQEFVGGGGPFRNTFPIAPGDVRRLFLAALALHAPGAHMVQASGDTKGLRFPNDGAHKLLGWRPEGK